MSQITDGYKIFGVPNFPHYSDIIVWKGEQEPPSHVAMFDRVERKMNFCRKGVPCEYATINGYCQLTACLKHLRERKAK